MKRLVSFLLTLGLCTTMLAANPLVGLLERIDRGASKKILIQLHPKGRLHIRPTTLAGDTVRTVSDYFELDQQSGKPLIRANNYISAAVGLNWYLKYYCGVQLSWNCMQSPLPTTLPAVPRLERHETSLRLRYNFNYCTFSYSMAFWDWERWQTEIDWMALHGINMPLAAVGHECVWRNMLLKLGYSEVEIGKFIAGPAFLAWWEMNNLEGWGGPLPLNWYTQQERLQKQILRRMREYGMTPVLPGYCGMVPSTLPSNPSDKGHAVKDEGSEESAQSTLAKWNGFDRPGILMPDDPRFQQFARLFYAETKALYGTADYYSIDPFHEAKNLPANLDFGKAGQTILREMKAANPHATWVVQGWTENPREEMLAAIEPSDILILDLFSECRPMWGIPSIWQRQQGYGQHEWLFCLLENFGANVGMHGRMDQLLENYYLTRTHPLARHLKGIGLTMEGSETNPIMYELMTELPWRTEQVTKEEWVKQYVKARYGLHALAADAHLSPASSPLHTCATQLQEAWLTLANSIYNCPRGNNQQGPSESIFCSRPSLQSFQASSWSKMVPYYDHTHTLRAATLLTQAAEEMQRAFQQGHISAAAWDNFQYDLVDACRQALADQARHVYHHMVANFKSFHKEGYQRNSQQFLSLLLLQDSLLATRTEFRVGHWTEQAKRIATNEAERQLYEWNARVQITTWGNRYCADTGKLRDYAHKEWNGLLKDFYYKRWKHYLDILQAELDGRLPMLPVGNSSTRPDDNPAATIDWYAMEEPWTLDRTPYPSHAEGNPLEMAQRVIQQLLALTPQP